MFNTGANTVLSKVANCELNKASVMTPVMNPIPALFSIIQALVSREISVHYSQEYVLSPQDTHKYLRTWPEVPPELFQVFATQQLMNHFRYYHMQYWMTIHL